MAEPSAVVSVNVMSVALGFVSVTANEAVPAASSTVASPIRTSGAASLSVIVPKPVSAVLPTVPASTLCTLTVNVSSLSSSKSSEIGTLKLPVAVVVPARIVTCELVAV